MLEGFSLGSDLILVNCTVRLFRDGKAAISAELSPSESVLPQRHPFVETPSWLVAEAAIWIDAPDDHQRLDLVLRIWTIAWIGPSIAAGK